MYTSIKMLKLTNSLNIKIFFSQFGAKIKDLPSGVGEGLHLFGKWGLAAGLPQGRK